MPHTIHHHPDENDSFVSLKIGGSNPTFFAMQQLSESRIMLDYGDQGDGFGPRQYYFTLSQELEDGSYYYFGDILVTTGEGVVGGTGGQVVMKFTDYSLPVAENIYLSVWFFHELDSTGVKEFFESIISNITIRKS